MRRNSNRAHELTRRGKFFIVPTRNAQSIKPAINRIQNDEIIRRNVAENPALNPIVFPERREVGQYLRLFLLKSQRTKFLPLFPIRQLGNQLGFFNRVEEMIHAVFQKVYVIGIEREALNICGVIGNISANVDDAADHSDARTLARHRRKFRAIDAANNCATAAHKFKRKTPDVFQNPKFRLFVKRIMFHKRAGSCACATADINFAARRTMTGSIARVAFYRDNSARIEPANIS